MLTTLSAIFLGAHLKTFAPASATLAEKSPFLLFAGFSIMKSGMGSAGSSPFATALPRASIIFVLSSFCVSLTNIDFFSYSENFILFK